MVEVDDTLVMSANPHALLSHDKICMHHGALCTVGLAFLLARFDKSFGSQQLQVQSAGVELAPCLPIMYRLRPHPHFGIMRLPVSTNYWHCIQYCDLLTCFRRTFVSVVECQLVMCFVGPIKFTSQFSSRHVRGSLETTLGTTSSSTVQTEIWEKASIGCRPETSLVKKSFDSTMV